MDLRQLRAMVEPSDNMVAECPEELEVLGKVSWI
jgi:hypothetical protein